MSDGKDLLPFVAPATAQAYIGAHEGARVVPYAAALEQAS